MDDYEIHRKAKNNNRLSGLLEASERYDSSSLSSNENGRSAGNIDSLDREALQAERQSDRYGYRKDADNDNTSKKRYSRDVDYAEGVLLFVIKSVAENKFYIHNMTLKNKSETVSLNAKDKIPRGLNSYDLSRTDNIANNVSNVNNTDTKFSLDVNFSYNELIKKPYIKKLC